MLVITIGELSRAVKKAMESSDFKTTRLQHKHEELFVYYYDSLCDLSVLRERISAPLAKLNDTRAFTDVLQSELGCEEIHDVTHVVDKLLLGNIVIYVKDHVFVVQALKPFTDQVREATVEATIEGPHYSLTENLQTNLNLIRQRYPNKELIVKEKVLGSISNTKLVLLYHEGLVQREVLEQVERQLSCVDIELVQSLGQLEVLMTKKKYRLFPIMLNTERPDRIAMNLSQGKVVILLDGIPAALVAPAVFYDFISAVDDTSQSFFVSHAIVLLRYMALLITIILPAMYIAIVSYNPEIFRIQLAVSIAGSRSSVPYPSFAEVFIMMFIIETLIEASIRLPKYIGQAATTVGGLILGQAAQQAGLVSSIMIIVTSMVAIVNFVIPINAMSYAMRVVKYPFILLSMFFGITGVITALFCFSLYLANIQSFGQPYFKLYIGEKSTTGYKHKETS